jgi:hypothetical protein
MPARVNLATLWKDATLISSRLAKRNRTRSIEDPPAHQLVCYNHHGALQPIL